MLCVVWSNRSPIPVLAGTDSRFDAGPSSPVVCCLEVRAFQRQAPRPGGWQPSTRFRPAKWMTAITTDSNKHNNWRRSIKEKKLRCRPLPGYCPLAMASLLATADIRSVVRLPGSVCSREELDHWRKSAIREKSPGERLRLGHSEEPSFRPPPTKLHGKKEHNRIGDDGGAPN